MQYVSQQSPSVNSRNILAAVVKDDVRGQLYLINQKGMTQQTHPRSQVISLSLSTSPPHSSCTGRGIRLATGLG